MLTTEDVGILMPALKNRFMVAFYHTKTNEVLREIANQVVRVNDKDGKLIIVLELDNKGRVLTDYAKFKKNRTDYAMMLKLMDGIDSVDSVFNYTGLVIEQCPFNDLAWDYGDCSVQSLTLRLHYLTRSFLSEETLNKSQIPI